MLSRDGLRWFHLIGLALALVLVPLSTGCKPEPGATTNAGGDAGSSAAGGSLPAPAYAQKGAVCRESFNVGESVQAFELPSLAGTTTISPSAYAGRVMVLNFWGTWCKPCMKELPSFGLLSRMYDGHGMSLVAVATDEYPAPVQDFVDKHKLAADVALAGEAAAGAYGRPEFPFTFVVDGSGTIVAAYQFIDESCMGDLEGVIRDELAKLAD